MKRFLDMLCTLHVIMASAGLALAQPGQPQRYALILRSAPLAQQVFIGDPSRAALSGPAAEIHRKMVLSSQVSLTTMLRQRKFAVTGSVQTLLNAVFVAASPSRLSELQAMPEVAGVVRLPSIRRKLNTALDLVGASTAWAAIGGAGNAGAGMKIAILDSGIDETHPGFQDPTLSTPAGFPKAGNIDDFRHATNKVIAVRSFVSALAIGDGTPQFTRPDDLSARDRVGHGTAVAMIAAGASHRSPLGTISGVAPKAWLGNYKIFGSPGVNDTTSADVALLALEAAFNDGMDVALLSAGSLPAVWAPTDQGSTCGLPSGTLCDPWVAAVANAARGNMVVVVPAGNSGNLGMGTINSPGDSPDAITVGASTNVHTLTSTVITPAGDRLEARLGDGPKPATSLKASLMTGAAVDSTGYGCLAFPQASLSGAIVVISTGQCADATKIFNAQAAGAAAVLLVEESVTAPLAAPRGLSNTSIPTALLTARSGAILKNYLSAHPGSLVTLDPAVSEARVADVEAIAPFSSRGPAIAGTSIKPDLVAPGGAIYTAAQSYDPNGDLYASARYAGVDGTSFAAAVVAGAAALIRQAHPSYSARQIKSALSNSAADISDNDGSPPPARSVAAGSGKLNLPSAIASTLTVEPVSISYGAVNGGLGPPRTITLTNTGQASAGIQLTVKRRDADSAAFVSVSPATFNLPAGQSQNVAVSLSGTVPPAGLYEGAIVVAGGAVPLRIPYRYVVSDGKAAQLVPLLGAGFVTETGSAVNLAVRVMDRFGVSLSNLPVRFAPAAAVLAATATTDSLGIAEAYLSTTEVVGSQSFAVDLEGNAARISFIGRTRPRPQIREGGVVDAASGKVPSGFAPGSYVSLFGSGLSESTSVFHTPYLPLSLAGVAVSFDIPAANVHVSGRLHFVSAGQINVQIPWELAGASSALLKVTLSNSASQSGRPEDPDLGTFQTQVLSIPLAPHAPAFFEYRDSNTGRTLAAALNEMNAVVTPSNPMRTGQIVQFFVNGLGPVAAGTQPASGEASPGTQPLALTQTTPVLTIGGRAATVQFSGLAPGLVGVYQVNALVPRDIGSGFQPVAISIGGVTSSSSTIIAQ